MLNRLNGWQRIGVVLTGLWIALILFSVVAGGLFTRIVPGSSPACSVPAIEVPSDRKTFTFDEAYGCAPGALIPAVPDRRVFNWGGLLFAVLVVPAGSWFSAYFLTFIIHWVAKGFRFGSSDK